MYLSLYDDYLTVELPSVNYVISFVMSISNNILNPTEIWFVAYKITQFQGYIPLSSMEKMSHSRAGFTICWKDNPMGAH